MQRDADASVRVLPAFEGAPQLGDLGIPRLMHGTLEHWARQGVLLLNASLTVEAHKAGSHAGRGWEAITDAAVAAVAKGTQPTVFILWGSHAQKKAASIPELASGPHLVIRSPHPSPLSAHRGFFGSRPFSKANAFLETKGMAPIDWALPACEPSLLASEP